MILIIKKYIEDILIFSGLALIIATTFLVSMILGLYTLGVILFGLGVFFSRHPPKEKER